MFYSYTYGYVTRGVVALAPTPPTNNLCIVDSSQWKIITV